jgi:hypothetical protein
MDGMGIRMIERYAPRIKAGDTVRSDFSYRMGEVVCLYSNGAVIKWDSGSETRIGMLATVLYWAAVNVK